MKLTIVVEKMDDGTLQGWTDREGWMPTPFGKTLGALKRNLKTLVEDYLKHEGKGNKYWAKVLDNWDTLDIQIAYDLQGLFEKYNYLNFSKVADMLKIHKTQLTHYKNGERAATSEMAQKIESALHELGQELTKAKLLVA